MQIADKPPFVNREVDKEDEPTHDIYSHCDHGMWTARQQDQWQDRGENQRNRNKAVEARERRRVFR
jgi:hypothetical protein